MRTISMTKKLLAVLVLTASVAACAAVTGRETGAEYVDDAAITAKVRAAIIADPNLKLFQVSVETMKDVVQLSGFVDSAGSKNKAGELARSVQGVRSVKNDLVVR